jgi:hypothetical protein
LAPFIAESSELLEKGYFNAFYVFNEEGKSGANGEILLEVSFSSS